jgi:hypothetical protein
MLGADADGRQHFGKPVLGLLHHRPITAGDDALRAQQLDCGAQRRGLGAGRVDVDAVRNMIGSRPPSASAVTTTLRPRCFSNVPLSIIARIAAEFMVPLDRRSVSFPQVLNRRRKPSSGTGCRNTGTPSEAAAAHVARASAQSGSISPFALSQKTPFSPSSSTDRRSSFAAVSPA